MLTQTTPPHAQLAAMSRWYIVSRAIHTVAKLKIANVIGETPIHLHEIANLTHTKPTYLLRILRFLCAYDIFNEPTQEYFIATPLSLPLRDDNPNTIADMMGMVDADWWEAFGNLEYCLKEGGAAYTKTHGTTFFEHLKTKPKQQLLYDTGMDRISALDNKAIVESYDFSDIHHLVDLGGGKGGILLELMGRYPQLNTTLFDSAEVLVNHHPELSNHYHERFHKVAGDFFKKIPTDADAYLFKGVLHDFSDDDTRKILKNCRAQIDPSARVLIAEQVIPEIPGPHPNKTMDIVMMALLDGRQHTLAQWQGMVRECGFKVTEVYNTPSIFTLFELRPVAASARS